MNDGCSAKKPSPYAVYAFMVPFIMVVANFTVGFQNLVYTKLCYSRYQDYELCTNSSFTESHPKIQEEAGRWLNYGTLVQMVPSITMVILLSSYTDKIGHKFPMVLSTVAQLLALCWCALISAKEFVDWPMLTVLVGPLLFGLGGAHVVVLMSSIGYISLITVDGKRGLYLSIFFAVLQGGQLIAVITQGPIIDSLGQVIFFVISATLAVVGLLIVIFIMIDLKKPGHQTARLRDIFNCDNYKQAAICVFRKREGYGRSLLQMGIATWMFVSFSNASEYSVDYLYFTKDIGMNLTYYSFFQGALGILRFIMPFTLLPLCQKVLKLDNITIAIFSVASMIFGYILFAQDTLWLLWVAIVVGSPQVISNGLIQDFNVRMVQKDEVGKMLAYLHLLQLVVDYLGSLIAKTVYINTLTVWAGSVFILLGSFNLVAMIFLIIIDRLSKKHEFALAGQMG